MRGLCRLGVVALIMACGSPAEFQIVRNQRALDDCRLSDVATDRISQGIFDLAIGDRSSYLLTPLVENDTGSPIMVSTARVRALEGGEALTFRCSDGGCSTWDLELCDPACPTIDAHDTSSFEVPVIPRVVSGFFQMQMDAAVAEGRTPPDFDIEVEVQLLGIADGSSVRSAWFHYPVHICLGCLVTFPPESDASGLPGPDCCGFRGEGGCYPGQDEAFSCGLCRVSVPEICNFGRLSCG